MTGIWWPLWGRGARSGSHIAYGRASATTDASLKSAPTIDERPRWIWVIFVFYVISTAWVLLSLLLIYSGHARVDAAGRDYVLSLTVFDFIATGGVSALTLSAGVLLLLRQRLAVALFSTALACNMGYALVHALTTKWFAAIGWSGAIGVLLAWCALFGVVLYSRRLAARGILT